MQTASRVLTFTRCSPHFPPGSIIPKFGEKMKKTLFLGALSIASAAAAIEPASTEANNQASDSNEVVCRRMQDTTSLAGSQRVCMTREQWARQRGATRPGNRPGTSRTNSPAQ